MTKREKLLALADQVESILADAINLHSTRETELAVFCALNPESEANSFGQQDSSGVHTSWEWTTGGIAYQRGTSWASFPIPRYLTSLEAAESAVPANCREWHVGKYYKTGQGQAYILIATVLREPIYILAATPAAALTAAALRAIATMERCDG